MVVGFLLPLVDRPHRASCGCNFELQSHSKYFSQVYLVCMNYLEYVGMCYSFCFHVSFIKNYLNIIKFIFFQINFLLENIVSYFLYFVFLINKVNSWLMTSQIKIYYKILFIMAIIKYRYYEHEIYLSRLVRWNARMYKQSTLCFISHRFGLYNSRNFIHIFSDSFSKSPFSAVWLQSAWKIRMLLFGPSKTAASKSRYKSLHFIHEDSIDDITRSLCRARPLRL